MIKIFLAAFMLACSVSSGAVSQAEGQRQMQTAEVAKLLKQRDYNTLLMQAETYAASQARFPDGLWRLSYLYQDFSFALQEQFSTDKDWKQAEAATASLAKKNPMGWLLHEAVLSARAWSIRGPGFSSQVSAQAFKGFRENLIRARSVLDTHKSVLSSNPAWYSIRISTAIELGEGEGAVSALFDEGQSRHPAYHAIYFGRLRHLSPLWGGSKPKMLDFLGAVQSLGGKALAEGMYARLLWIAEEMGTPLIHDPQIDPTALRQNVDQLLAAFPDERNAQKLFFMACERSDKVQAAKILRLVKEPPLPEIWKRNLPLAEDCTDWAQGRLPAFIIRDRDGDTITEHLIQ